jgi:hypothetical protein
VRYLGQAAACHRFLLFAANHFLFERGLVIISILILFLPLSLYLFQGNSHWAHQKRRKE